MQNKLFYFFILVKEIILKSYETLPKGSRSQGVVILIFHPFTGKTSHFCLLVSQSLMSPFITTYTLFTLKHQLVFIVIGLAHVGSRAVFLIESSYLVL